MISKRDYILSTGSVEIYDSFLKFTTVLSCIREGNRYYHVSPLASSIDTFEYSKLYDSSSIAFGVPAGASDPGGTMDGPEEKVTLIVKS